MHGMNAFRHIRKNVLSLSQAELALIAGVSQGTVSKWENGESNPNRDEMSRIREAAIARDLPWEDVWFFEAPSEAAQ